VLVHVTNLEQLPKRYNRFQQKHFLCLRKGRERRGSKPGERKETLNLLWLHVTRQVSVCPQGDDTRILPRQNRGQRQQWEDSVCAPGPTAAAAFLPHALLSIHSSLTSDYGTEMEGKMEGKPQYKTSLTLPEGVYQVVTSLNGPGK
jgi:hypothetical protein